MLRVLSVLILPHQYFLSRQLILYSAVPFGAMVRSCMCISTHCPKLLLVGCLLIIYLQDTRPVSELCRRVSNAEECGCKATRASFHKVLFLALDLHKPNLCCASLMLQEWQEGRRAQRAQALERVRLPEKGRLFSELLTPFFCSDVSQRSDFPDLFPA